MLFGSDQFGDRKQVAGAEGPLHLVDQYHRRRLNLDFKYVQASAARAATASDRGQLARDLNATCAATKICGTFGSHRQVGLQLGA
ncbi:hypothetical protein NKH99_14770 [Mesorhizobium sp. M0854]|uniref:hypothetical protein n=1 Tax=Mesorhizobium sp. M0854 TaxID=2957013 RepID=UPI00333A3837